MLRLWLTTIFFSSEGACGLSSWADFSVFYASFGDSFFVVGATSEIGVDVCIYSPVPELIEFDIVVEKSSSKASILSISKLKSFLLVSSLLLTFSIAY